MEMFYSYSILFYSILFYSILFYSPDPGSHVQGWESVMPLSLETFLTASAAVTKIHKKALGQICKGFI